MKLRDFLLLVLLSLAVLVIHGYHPYSDDASIYVASVKIALHPGLYATDSTFVVSHGKFSLFSQLVATLISIFHLNVDATLLACYVTLTAAFLLAGFQLASLMFPARAQARMATLFLACCFTMPVAATSLLLMDPYLSARSFSAPFSLFAVVAVLRKSWKQAAFWLVATALLHPLMAIYLVAFLLVLLCTNRGQWKPGAALCIAGFAAAGAVYLATRHASVSPSYREAAFSRTYYFLAGWHWYEVMGVLLPLLLMWFAWRRSRSGSVLGRLAFASLVIGSTCLLASACFVHPGGSYFLMRLQFLRSFHSIYVIGILMLGGWLAAISRKRLAPVAWGAYAVAALALFFAQRASYSSYPDVELPGQLNRSPWQTAFLWVRSTTPPDALFAAEPERLDSVGGDTPGFRALAERSILTDKKDEGLASLFPAISASWQSRRDAELGLDHLTDAQRLSRLQPFGVNWLLLSPQAATSFPCPYRNAVVIICEIGTSGRAGSATSQ